MQNVHLQPDETGNVPSPFPYLNPESRDWQGDDERDEDDDFDAGGGILAPYQPMPDPDWGGDEVDPDEEDDGDDSDRGFGFMVGIGLLMGNHGQPRTA